MNGNQAFSHSSVVVQLLSHFWRFGTLRAAACRASLSFTVSWTLLRLCPLSRWCHPTIFLCCPLLLSSVFPSIRVFSNALHIRWPKYWSFSFSIRPSSEFSGVIPFRIDWFNLLAVKGTLKSLLQHQNLKASILWVVLLLWGFSGDSDGEKSAWSAGEPRSVPGSRRWDALENEIVTHSSIFAWRLPGQEPRGGYTVHRVAQSGTWMSNYHFTSDSLWSNSHIHTRLVEKPWLWLCRPLSAKWCLCFCFLFFVFFFNILSKFVIAFLPRSKCLLISWLQSPSAVILEPKKIKSTTVSVTDIRRNIFENGRLVCLWPYQVHTDTKYLWQMFMAPFLHPVKR